MRWSVAGANAVLAPAAVFDDCYDFWQPPGEALRWRREVTCHQCRHNGSAMTARLVDEGPRAPGGTCLRHRRPRWRQRRHRRARRWHAFRIVRRRTVVKSGKSCRCRRRWGGGRETRLRPLAEGERLQGVAALAVPPGNDAVRHLANRPDDRASADGGVRADDRRATCLQRVFGSHLDRKRGDRCALRLQHLASLRIADYALTMLLTCGSVASLCERTRGRMRGESTVVQVQEGCASFTSVSSNALMTFLLQRDPFYRRQTAAGR